MVLGCSWPSCCSTTFAHELHHTCWCMHDCTSHLPSPPLWQPDPKCSASAAKPQTPKNYATHSPEASSTCCLQAAQAREAQLAAAAARAGEQVAHAKAVTAAVKAAEESASAARASALERRLARAELARLESVHAVINSIPQVNCWGFSGCEGSGVCCGSSNCARSDGL